MENFGVIIDVIVGGVIVVERTDFDFGVWLGFFAGLRHVEILNFIDEGEGGGTEFGGDGDAVVLSSEFEGDLWLDEVCFVEDTDAGFLVESELFEDGVDGGDLGMDLRI